MKRNTDREIYECEITKQPLIFKLFNTIHNIWEKENVTSTSDKQTFMRNLQIYSQQMSMTYPCEIVLHR